MAEKSLPPQAAPAENLPSPEASSEKPTEGLEGSRPPARRASLVLETPVQPPARLRGIEEEARPGPPISRRGSLLADPPPVAAGPPFSRRSSLAGPGAGGRRPSLGAWPPPPGTRVSFSGLPLPPGPPAPCENTYRTGPEPGGRWNPERAQRALEAALAGSLGEARYSAPAAGPLARSLCELVRARLRELSPPRYKLVCSVVLGPRAGQDLRVASRALWDPANDGLASASFANASLFAVATVHGLYRE
ncbi:LOW QUALITY PROTEIN: dynein light chain Tctex-type 4 [Ornithorhynchus anatinus]|uniref:LOW QUALITY PROTEIN: dynein light chain Tctex-type 4 n=1 Tax=Ornithorhynchus anatinus TaxID=9258 RepID=UPI0010A7D776|nr:LOW QUALITY PROTEIN: dynein light chain Tctex-type 4 [Ornithorhynchus anatinus]